MLCPRGNISCIMRVSSFSPNGPPSLTESSLERLSLTVGKMEEDHQDYERHHDNDRDVPVDTQPCYNIVEGAEGEDVAEIIKGFFIVHSQTPEDVE